MSQERVMRDLQISLENIKMATQEFSQENCVGSGREWKVHKGELSHPYKANANILLDVAPLLQSSGCGSMVKKIINFGQNLIFFLITSMKIL